MVCVEACPTEVDKFVTLSMINDSNDQFVIFGIVVKQQEIQDISKHFG